MFHAVIVLVSLSSPAALYILTSIKPAPYVPISPSTVTVILPFSLSLTVPVTDTPSYASQLSLNGEYVPVSVEASNNVSEPDTTFKLLTTAVVPITANPTLTSPISAFEGSSSEDLKLTLPSAVLTSVVYLPLFLVTVTEYTVSFVYALTTLLYLPPE